MLSAMRITRDQLTIKALLALEEAEKRTGEAPLPRSYWLRFVLAYLCTVSIGDRGPFDRFWQAVTDTNEGWSAKGDGIQRRANAGAALEAIYIAVGVQRTRTMMFHEVHADKSTLK